MSGNVKVWQEQVELPTYLTGKQDTTRCFWPIVSTKALRATSIRTA